jgi:hypothetical protein
MHGLTNLKFYHVFGTFDFHFSSSDFPTSFPFLPLEVKQHKVSFKVRRLSKANIKRRHSLYPLHGMDKRDVQ